MCVGSQQLWRFDWFREMNWKKNLRDDANQCSNCEHYLVGSHIRTLQFESFIDWAIVCREFTSNQNWKHLRETFQESGTLENDKLANCLDWITVSVFRFSPPKHLDHSYLHLVISNSIVYLWKWSPSSAKRKQLLLFKCFARRFGCENHNLLN